MSKRAFPPPGSFTRSCFLVKLQAGATVPSPHVSAVFSHLIFPSSLRYDDLQSTASLGREKGTS